MTAKVSQSGVGRTKRRRTGPAQSDLAFDQPARTNNVISFPVFEHIGDQIHEWLAEIGREPKRHTVLRLVKSMRCTAVSIDSVRDSMRHSHLAVIVRHAASALEASEWEGARYLLMTSLALMTARAVSAKDVAEIASLRQLPLATEVDELPAATGIVTG